MKTENTECFEEAKQIVYARLDKAKDDIKHDHVQPANDVFDEIIRMLDNADETL